MHSLESLLAAMTPYGRPSLFQLDDGWHCKVSMFVTAKGAKFNIASEFNHDTAADAAQVCLDRMRGVIGDIAATVSQPIVGRIDHV